MRDTRGVRGAVGAAILVVGSLAGASLAGASSSWTTRLLPLPDGWAGSAAMDVDSAGRIGGMLVRSDFLPTAAVWDGDDIVVLPSPGGSPDDSGQPYRMNDNGLFVGNYWPASTGYANFHATVWDILRETATDIHPDVEYDGTEYPDSFASDVNARGDIAMVLFSDSGMLAYVLPAGKKEGVILPPPEGFLMSEACGLDAAGNVGGMIVNNAQWNRQACWWGKDGSFVNVHAEIQDALPGLQVTESWYGDMTEDGTLVGVLFTTYDYVPWAFTWSLKDGVRVLDRGGAEASAAWGIEGNLVVGSLGGFWWRPHDLARPALWEKGTLHVLDRPEGYGFADLADANARGDAVGTAYEGYPWDGAYIPRGFLVEKSGR